MTHTPQDDADAVRIIGFVVGSVLIGLVNLFATMAWDNDGARSAKKLKVFRIISAAVWFLFSGPGSFILLCYIWVG